MSTYSQLIDSYINNSGLTLEQIAERCKQAGVDIHPTYISKLRNGTRLAPSEEISKAIATACNQDPEPLIYAGYLNKTPVPILEVMDSYKKLWETVKTEILNNYPSPFLTTEENKQISKYLDRIDEAPLEVQTKLISDWVSFMVAIKHELPANYNIPTPIKSTSIPILGTIRAGIPILADDNWEEQINVPTHLNADFALRVVGDSMSWIGIHPGDLAILRQLDNPQHGMIVAAGIEDAVWTATLKYFIQENSTPKLRSANPEYEDILISPNHRIIGQVVSIIKEPPSILTYKVHLVAKEIVDQHWRKAIEKAAQYGMSGEQVAQMIELFRHMAKQV